MLRVICLATFLLIFVALSGCQVNRHTNFFTSFDSEPSYVVPHKFKTTYSAASFEKGVLKLTVRPGMFGASSDSRNGSERAELGKEIPLESKVVMSFRFRLTKDFRAEARTMISQIKFEPSDTSPSVAVYVDGGGKVKCLSYSPSRQHQLIQDFDSSIDINDGNWHRVEITLIPSYDKGYCSVSVDGKNQIEYCELTNIPTRYPEKIHARIGIYRDSQPYSQTVYFDDWKVQTFPAQTRVLLKSQSNDDRWSHVADTSIMFNCMISNRPEF